MQNDKITFEILKLVTTRSDVARLTRELNELKSSLYKLGEGSFDTVLAKAIRAPLATLINSSSLKKDVLINEILKKLEELEYISLQVAFVPSSAGIASILGWVRTNLKEDLLLDIKTDPKILGGAVIEYQGKYIDMSLARKLEEYFNAKI